MARKKYEDRRSLKKLTYQPLKYEETGSEFSRKEWRQIFESVRTPMQRLQTFDVISSY